MAPIVLLQNCQIEGDLAQAVLDVEQQISEFTKIILDQVSAFPNDTTDIDNANAVLDNMLMVSPTPVDPNLNHNIGIPTQPSTSLDEEERLEGLGLILIRGILYLSGGDNIEALRRLYFAVGADTDRFLALLAGSDPLIVTQTYLAVKKLPSRPTWLLQEVRALYNNSAIEAIYSAADGEKYVVVPNYLGVNISKEQAALASGLDIDKITTNVFWLRSVIQTPAVLAKLSQLGITGSELSAALLGDRLVDAQPTSVSSVRNQAGVATSKAIAQLELLKGRYTKIDTASKQSLCSDALSSVREAQKLWYQLEEKVRFYSTVILRPEDMTTFLEKNVRADIDYLFTRRRTVTGINFLATTQELATRVTQALNISSGTSTLSTLAVNSQRVVVDTFIDSANGSLIRNFCAEMQLFPVANLTYPKLIIAIDSLNGSLLTVTSAATSNTPQIGYASYDSPASILFRNTNWTVTLNTNGITDEIDAAADAIFDLGIRQVLKAIVALVKNIQRMIDSVIDSFQAIIAGFVRAIEGFMSKFMSFHGTAALDSSILKCVAGLDMDATLPFLDELSPLLEQLRRKLKNVLAKMVGIISDLLTKILCAPINLMNSFITGASSFLPDFCQTDKFKLPADIEALLIELQNCSKIQQTNAVAFSRDALRVSLTLQSLPLKLNQFRKSLLCESNSNNRFFKASKTTANIGLLPNPVAAVAGSIL